MSLLRGKARPPIWKCYDHSPPIWKHGMIIHLGIPGLKKKKKSTRETSTLSEFSDKNSSDVTKACPRR